MILATQLCGLLIALLPAAPGLSQETESPLPRRIWDAAPHSAFTDLCLHRGRLYCTFREGTGHVPGPSGRDGTVRVIASADGREWTSVASLEREGLDLRDPKISVMPDGRLMVVMGGSNYDGNRLVDRQPQVSFSDVEGTQFSSPTPIVVDPVIASKDDWLWRVTWQDGIAYGAVYQARKDDWGFHLVRSRDGQNYEHVTTIRGEGRWNEATIRFRPDGEMVMVVRREGGSKQGMLGFAAAPYETWTFQEIPLRLGGPNFLVLEDGSLLLGTRYYDKPGGAITVLARVDREANLLGHHELPSGGDTSYPGMLIEDDRLWMSYYSGHEGKTSVYLVEMTLPQALTLTREKTPR